MKNNSIPLPKQSTNLLVFSEQSEGSGTILGPISLLNRYIRHKGGFLLHICNFAVSLQSECGEI
jgi:hypothetical protein